MIARTISQKWKLKISSSPEKNNFIANRIKRIGKINLKNPFSRANPIIKKIIKYSIVILQYFLKLDFLVALLYQEKRLFLSVFRMIFLTNIVSAGKKLITFFDRICCSSRCIINYSIW